MRDMQPQAGKAAAGPEAQRGMMRLRPDERTMRHDAENLVRVHALL